ncbi:MAG: HAMP domain-containing protein, partial [Magnetococcales bacterium]|nr:HAMP domain-containing protein [Magnetococcales bacterium]
RGEKDFFLRLDEKYVEEVTNQITCIQSSAFDLQEMATQLDERVLAQDSEKIITLSQEYHARFDDIAEMWRKKGLTPESGFQGQFRKSAHALEKAINNLDTSTLWRIYLEMRRNEKDFAVRTKQEYRARFETNLQHFQKSLQESRLDESVRKEINDLLQGYVQQVQSYMIHRLQGEALDVELPLYKAQSESAHKLEEAIRQRYVNTISTYYLLLRRYEKDYLLRDEKKYVQQLQQMVGKINQEIKASQVPQQGQDTLLSLVADYERAFTLLTSADEKIMLASEMMRNAIHAVEPVIEHLISTMNRVESERLAEIDAEVDHSVTLARWVSLMASLLGLVVVLIVGRAIIVPVRRVANFLVDIGQKGEGDLRFRLPADRHDELGRLAQGFNLFMGCLEVSMREIDLQSRTINGNVTALNNMRIDIMGVAHSIHQAMVAVTSANRGLVQETNTIRGNSGQVLERVQEMTQAAKILKEHVYIISQAAESGSDSAQSLAGNVDSASSGVSQVNGNLVAVSQQLITVSSAVEEMTISLREVGHRCERAANRSQEVTVTTSQASRVMVDLSRAAREINKVVNAIRGIAGQTNLLALNAAIEAAGAGEAGKGFAVVANEVKELSKQTAEATRMISQEIDHIQKQIDVARQGMEGIDNGIQEITQLNQDISSAVQEQNLTVTEIARSLAKVSDATNNVTQAALQIEANLTEVSQAASQAQQQAWQQAGTAREVDKAANTVSQGVTIALEEMVQVMDAVRRTDSEAQLVLDHTLQVNRLASKAMGISEAFGHIIDLTTTTAHALHGIRSRLAIN